MLSNKGFDLWANNYDKTVCLSEEANKYPFAGYKDVLNTIYRTIKNGSGKKILDIGFGTGILSKKLYDEGYSIYGIDFSEKMLEIAREKMPMAAFIQHDFSKGLPASLHREVFDFIICTYAIHHLDDSQKVDFIKKLTAMLSAQGKVLIGDVAFLTVDELEQCKLQSGSDWDKDEIYPVVEVLKPFFPITMHFEKISFCAGVFTF